MQPEGTSLALEIVDPAAPGGVRRHAWRFLGRNECQRCHNEWAETTLAFNVAQFNRDVSSADRSWPVNQLRDFRDRGLVEAVVVEPDLVADHFATPKRAGRSGCSGGICLVIMPARR